MAVGLTVKTHGLFESNDDGNYYGVTGISFNAGLGQMTLSGTASASNFGASVTINMTTIRRVEILPASPEFPGNSASQRPPGT